jgi:hypothetical protein
MAQGLLTVKDMKMGLPFFKLRIVILHIKIPSSPVENANVGGNGTRISTIYINSALAYTESVKVTSLSYISVQ